jgi:hypothetical protein
VTAAAAAGGSPATTSVAREGEHGVQRVVPRAAGERLAPVHAWDAVRVRPSGGVTLAVLVATGLLLLAGIAGGGFGFVRIRTRRPAPWVPPAVAVEARARDILMEAELQEILAEARAREVLSEPEPEPTPGRELVAGPS